LGGGQTVRFCSECRFDSRQGLSDCLPVDVDDGCRRYVDRAPYDEQNTVVASFGPTLVRNCDVKETMADPTPLGHQVPSTKVEPLDDKEWLHRWLRLVRDVMLWKLEGLSDADIRRPMTRSATNLLGLIKHITYGEIEYLGDAFGRPSTPPPWWEPQNVQHTLETGGDMYAVPGETTQYIVDLYRKACANADQTIAELDLDTVGTLPRSGEKFTLRQAMMHMIQETSRHAGHADIVRELIDGSIGGARENPWVPDDIWLREHHARVEASASAAEHRID
jgi:uncharacterized damage-inducible protein DinB